MSRGNKWIIRSNWRSNSSMNSQIMLRPRSSTERNSPTQARSSSSEPSTWNTLILRSLKVNWKWRISKNTLVHSSGRRMKWEKTVRWMCKAIFVRSSETLSRSHKSPISLDNSTCKRLRLLIQRLPKQNQFENTSRISSANTLSHYERTNERMSKVQQKLSIIPKK